MQIVSRIENKNLIIYPIDYTQEDEEMFLCIIGYFFKYYNLNPYNDNVLFNLTIEGDIKHFEKGDYKIIRKLLDKIRNIRNKSNINHEVSWADLPQKEQKLLNTIFTRDEYSDLESLLEVKHYINNMFSQDKKVLNTLDLLFSTNYQLF